MSVEKPTTWLQTSIGSLCNLINGRAFKPKEWSEVGLPIIRIQNLNNPNATYNHFDGELADKHRIESGDLLFAWSGTPGTSFGAHVWKGETAALNQHIFKIEFIEALIDKRFLRYAINQTLDELISGAHGGVGLRHVTKGKFEATDIAFPPLAEQKVIADKLDTLLAQVENTKARLERIPQILKRFRQSVLAAAVSGRLVKGVSFAPTTQEIVKFEEILKDKKKLSYGVLKPGDFDESGTPMIRVMDIGEWGEFKNTDVFKISKKLSQEYKRTIVEKGDIVLSVMATIGRSAIVPETLEGANVNRALAVIKLREGVMPEYVQLQLLSPFFQEAFVNKQIGSAQKRINLSDLRKFDIWLPDNETQSQIVQRVDRLFEYVDRIEQQVNNALARINNLTQSILAKAFRGELTEKWRKDNPELISGENGAEALLERIKAEREVSGRQNRKKITSRTKKGGKSMAEKITLVEALKHAGKPLTGQQLLTAAGYPSDSNTEQLEQFFLELRDAVAMEQEIVKLERDDDGQDWFTLTEKDDQPSREA